MQLGLVVGTVVASVKADGMDGVKLLIVQPLDKQQQPMGRAVIAADAITHPDDLAFEPIRRITA